jgi:hypothetical protein
MAITYTGCYEFTISFEDRRESKMESLLWLMGFPTPVLEFFVFAILLFLVGAVTLARNIEDVSGIEGPDVQRRQNDHETNVMED